MQKTEKKEMTHEEAIAFLNLLFVNTAERFRFYQIYFDEGCDAIKEEFNKKIKNRCESK